MLINEVCKKCQLTKKAIEYYEEQKLLSPNILENGYRDFSEEDAVTLSRISVLRRLGLSVADIRSALADSSFSALRNISNKQILELENMQAKSNLTLQLANGEKWETIRLQLDQLEKKQSILSRLLEKFPGYYGRYAAFHFAAFLNEPIRTPEQQEAFDTIILFLDQIEISIQTEMKSYLEEIELTTNTNMINTINKNLALAVEHPEQYLSENKEILERYMAFTETDEYKSSPAFRLKNLLQNLNQQNGYNEVFIPAMCKLSQSYHSYYEKLQKANEVFQKHIGTKLVEKEDL